MVRDYDETAAIVSERVVVCITAQHNSERLIDEAAALADRLDSELHILHVNKGESIFNTADKPALLDMLFEYGSEKGGMVHMLCCDDVAKAIGDFIEEYNITKIVLGEPPLKSLRDKGMESEFDRIFDMIKKKNIELIMVNRPEKVNV